VRRAGIGLMAASLLLAGSIRAESLQDDIEDAGLQDRERRMKEPTRNLSPEEIAERDRPISRQARRQMERLRKKGREQ
jgi:hypothetical protein